MPRYVITDTKEYSKEVIENDMYGANFVTTYDHEFPQNEGLIEVLKSLGVSTFRFPGGGVTEGEFTQASFLIGDWTANSVIWREEEKTLTPFAEFFETASQVNANVQLVIPTRVAFMQSAGQALADGVYGNREAIDPQYFALLKAYVEEALREASENGVAITRLEIGNEFWLGGEMSASEYGHLAAEIILFLDEEFPGIDIVTQIVASGGKFSPVDARDVYLEPDGIGDYVIHSVDGFQGSPPSDWLQATMPANGNALTQTRAIADALQEDPTVLNIIDGIVEHIYFDGGFEGVDDQRDFAIRTTYERFCEWVDRTDLDYFITEWSPRNPRSSEDSRNLGNANGLQYAHMTVEVFFELTSNGIDGANFWPVTFSNPNTELRTLIDSQDQELTFGGVAFAWLSSATLGMRAIADFEVAGELSVHAFGDDEGVVLFVGDRDGLNNTGTNQIELGLSELDIESDYFVTVSRLTSHNGSFDDISADAVVTHTSGFMAGGDFLLELDIWELAMVSMQFVTEEDDHIHGTNNNDAILGEGGDDRISGLEGDDSIKGQFGHDELRGGPGEDTLKGGRGNDQLYGGDGNDTIYTGVGTDLVLGGEGDDVIFLQTGETAEAGWGGLNVNGNGQTGTMQFVSIEGMNRYSHVVDGGDGLDRLILSDENDVYFLQDGFTDIPEHTATVLTPRGSQTAARFQGVELIDASRGNDLVDLTSDMFVSGGVTVLGGSGNDTIWGSSSDERLEGGSGEDFLFGGAGQDTLIGGIGADVFEFTRTSTQTHLEDFSTSEGDRLVFYNRGGAGFDDLSVRLNGNMLEIDLDLTGSREEFETLSIKLSKSALASIQSNGLSNLEVDVLF